MDVLSVDDAAAQHLPVSRVPDGELTGCDAALRLVEKDIQPVGAMDKRRFLQGLAVTDPDLAVQLPGHGERQVGADPVDLFGADVQCLAVEAGVVLIWCYSL